MFSIPAPHRHCKQRQGPWRRWQLRVRVRRERVSGLAAGAVRRHGRQVVANLIGALPLLEGLGPNGQGASAHRQEHDERAQKEGHHRPKDAVQQDGGVMGTPPQHVVGPETKASKSKSRNSTRCLSPNSRLDCWATESVKLLPLFKPVHLLLLKLNASYQQLWLKTSKETEERRPRPKSDPCLFLF